MEDCGLPLAPRLGFWGLDTPVWSDPFVFAPPFLELASGTLGLV